MVVTNDVLIANYPSDGWSSSWGLSNSPRPGGMARVYRVTASQAWGNAAALASGMNFLYNGVGSPGLMRWDGTTKLTNSTTVPFLLWDHFSHDATRQQLDISWGVFPLPDFPFFCEWGSAHTITIPASREPFFYPTPADCPCGVLHVGGMGQGGVEIRPLNDNALAVWA